jgi:hypothetical protein
VTVDILIGILALITGAAFCVAGLRFFFILLPIWGFIAGFFTGASLISAVFGDGFLSTTLGIVIGLVFGLLFALISYLYWYISVILAAAYVGFVFAAALFATFGVDTEWVLFLVGLALAVLFGIGAYMIQLPFYLIIASTALAGAAIAIGGFMLVFDQIDRSDIGEGIVWEKIGDNLWLWIIWVFAGALGIGAQLMSVSETNLPDDRWTKAQGTVVA